MIMKNTTNLFIDSRTEFKIQHPYSPHVSIQYAVWIWRSKITWLLNNSLNDLRFNNLGNLDNLLIHKISDRWIENIQIDEGLKNNIISYLKNQKTIRNTKNWLLTLWDYFDCWEFICFIKNWDLKSNIQYINDDWTYNSWDVIWFWNTENNLQHYALYLWKDLFLQHYWEKPFVICKKEHIISMYGTNVIRKIIEKTED